MVDHNAVTIVFTDGTSLNVQYASRLIGADWVYAEIVVESGEERKDNSANVDEVILQADEIRYIRCDQTYAPNEAHQNYRIHCSDNWDAETVGRGRGEIWKAQYKLHPDKDLGEQPHM